MYDMYGIFTIIYLHDWVILFGQMLVNIPAPWFAYGVLLLGGFKHGWIIPCGNDHPKSFFIMGCHHSH